MARQKWGAGRPEAERSSLRGKNSAAPERWKPRCPARLSAKPNRKISGAHKIKIVKKVFCEAVPFRGTAAGRSDWIFSRIFDKANPSGVVKTLQ